MSGNIIREWQCVGVLYFNLLYQNNIATQNFDFFPHL